MAHFLTDTWNLTNLQRTSSFDYKLLRSEKANFSFEKSINYSFIKCYDSSNTRKFLKNKFPILLRMEINYLRLLWFGNFIWSTWWNLWNICFISSFVIRWKWTTFSNASVPNTESIRIFPFEWRKFSKVSWLHIYFNEKKSATERIETSFFFTLKVARKWIGFVWFRFKKIILLMILENVYSHMWADKDKSNQLNKIWLIHSLFSIVH